MWVPVAPRRANLDSGKPIMISANCHHLQTYFVRSIQVKRRCQDHSSGQFDNAPYPNPSSDFESTVSSVFYENRWESFHWRRVCALIVTGSLDYRKHWTRHGVEDSLHDTDIIVVVLNLDVVRMLEWRGIAGTALVKSWPPLAAQAPKCTAGYSSCQNGRRMHKPRTQNSYKSRTTNLQHRR